MDEETWVAAMRAVPACLTTMAAFADWLLERGDRRGEILVMMVNDGKVGSQIGYYGGDWQASYSIPRHARIGFSLFADGVTPLRDALPHSGFCDQIANRVAIMAAWAAADDARRATYLADYLTTL